MGKEGGEGGGAGGGGDDTIRYKLQKAQRVVFEVQDVKM